MASTNTSAATVTAIAKSYGIPPWLALDIAQMESGMNPKAVGDHGTSFGLFQLHKGGQLGNLTKQQAFNATTNSQVGLTAIKAGYLAGVRHGYTGQVLLDYTATHSGHPDYLGRSYTNLVEPSYLPGLNAIYAAHGGTKGSGYPTGKSYGPAKANTSLLKTLDNKMSVSGFNPLKPTGAAGTGFGIRLSMALFGLLLILGAVLIIVNNARSAII